MTIAKSEFKRSIEQNLKYYEDKLNELPKDCSVLRNNVHAQIRAIHKIKADVFLNRDGTVDITPAESKEAEDYLLKMVEEL